MAKSQQLAPPGSGNLPLGYRTANSRNPQRCQRLKHTTSRIDKWRRAVLQLDGAWIPSSLRQGFGKLAHAKQWLQAILLLYGASEASLRVDEAAYNSVASACNGARSLSMAWRVALKNLILVRKVGMKADKFSYGIAAVACSGMSFWSRSCLLLTDARRASVRLGAIAWSSVLDANSKAGRWKKTQALLQEMQNGSEAPDTQCINVQMSAISRAAEAQKLWQVSLEVLKTAAASIGVDEVSFNTALMLLDSSGSVDDKVWSLISAMRKASIRPSQVTYGTASRVFGMSSLWSSSLEALRNGSCIGVVPNIVACGSTLDACQRCAAWSMACMLLKDISTAQLQANAPACGAVITAAGNSHQWSHTLAMLSHVETMYIAITAPIIGAVMSACQGAADVMTLNPDANIRTLWQQVLGSFRLWASGRPDLPMIGSAVSACSRGDRWEQALELLTFSAVWRVQPSLVVLNSALDGMDRAGHWAQAANLLFGLSPATVSLDSLGLRSMMQAVEASGITGQMPALLAKTELWIQSAATTLKPSMDQKADVGFLVEALDSILEHSDVQAACLRQVHCCLLPALTALSHRRFNLRDHPRALQRQSSLGRFFTKLVLEEIHTGQDMWASSSEGMWKADARLRNFRALLGLRMVGRDPAAKSLVACCSGVITSGLAAPPEISCRWRLHGRSDLEVLAHSLADEVVTAVYVDHDRRPHCERQALVGQMQHLLAAKGLEAIEEGYPADIPLVVILGLSNPEISPTRVNNIWTFEAFSLSTGEEQLLNVNLNVTGFKIFGEFSGAYVTGTVLSPLATNVVGIWLNLKSPLRASLDTGQTSQMRLWLPPTFQPLPDCGNALFSLSYDVGRELVKNPFPITISYLSLPSGTYCFDRYDEISGQWYVELTIEQEVSYGLDYAFEFGLTNPFRTPATADNVWRFETLQNDVILHLRRSVPGFELEQIKDVRVTPSDTTTLLPLHRLEFYIMSDKYIPGGSKIEITAPHGFGFTCAFFSTDAGLAITTTCYVRMPNIAEFTMDTSDPKQPNSPFRLFVYAMLYDARTGPGAPLPPAPPLPPTPHQQQFGPSGPHPPHRGPPYHVSQPAPWTVYNPATYGPPRTPPPAPRNKPYYSDNKEHKHQLQSRREGYHAAWQAKRQEAAELLPEEQPKLDAVDVEEQEDLTHKFAAAIPAMPSSLARELSHMSLAAGIGNCSPPILQLDACNTFEV
ncbi:Pentatricopeptide repeat-containing protein, chloroplastic [Symbiodinium microadriaticum]|uniref:Pentatricopeptide repeat-containing protein, chloroplastic n=1 Tax=Symbiodinium microadriaticum TaxID=2951 RepID=A0A1Q9DNW4_SYMMI|nr:Pentatricopeptide repeat-containing protein, chloroplastic [Symbiodinium microadriaticum]